MKTKKYIIIYFLFCALVLGNGAIPTALAKVLLVLGASTYLIPGSRTWMILKPYFLWCILFSGFCIASVNWAYNRNEAMSWITTIVFVYICNVSLSAIIINQKNDIHFNLKLFVYFGLLMCISFLLTNGLQYGEELDRTDSKMNMNTIGMVAATTFVISFYLHKWESRFKKSNKFLIIAFLSIVIVLLSASRKALLIPFIAYAISKLAGKKPSRVFMYIAFLSIVGVLSLWAILKVPILYNIVGYRIEGLINGFFDTGGDIDASTKTRMIFIEVGMIFFGQNPMFGNGAANFGALYADFFPGRDPVFAHNNYVELLADYGIIGTLLYYSFYIFIIVKLLNIIKFTKDQVAILFLSIILSLMVVQYGFVAYYDLFTNIILSFTACYVLTKKYK